MPSSVESRLHDVEHAVGGVVGGVVVNLHIGSGLSARGVVVGHESVEVGGEPHRYGVDFLILQRVDVGLANGLLQDDDAAVERGEDGCHALGHILHADSYHVLLALGLHVADADTHEAVDKINEQTGHDDGGEHQLAVAKETGKFLADDGPGVVAVFHSSSPFCAL